MQLKKQKWVSVFYAIAHVSVLLLYIAWIVSIYYCLPKLETGFLPDMDEGSIVLDYTSPPGTSLEETDRITGS